MADEDDDYTDEASEAVELPEASEFVTNKAPPGQAPSTAKVPNQDPENIAWRLQGRASRCGQDAIRIGVQFVGGAQVAQPLPSPDTGPRRSPRASIAVATLEAGAASCFKKSTKRPLDDAGSSGAATKKQRRASVQPKVRQDQG